MTVRVTSASGFMCRHVFYTVPSRLVGHRLHLRIHDERIEAYLGGSFVLSVPRGRRAKGAGAVHVVDYRHIIAALWPSGGTGRRSASTPTRRRSSSAARPQYLR